MEGILSKEEAEAFELPRNPVHRHMRVAAYLQEVRSLGRDVEVSRAGMVKIEGIPIYIRPTGLILGRRALVNLAEAAETIDETMLHDKTLKLF